MKNWAAAAEKRRIGHFFGRLYLKKYSELEQKMWHALFFCQTKHLCQKPGKSEVVGTIFDFFFSSEMEWPQSQLK